MTNTSMDSRTRAQRYADRRWWAEGVKVVGYAIHDPIWDIGDRVKVYFVELLHRDGHKTTRWVSVTTDNDGSGCLEAFEVTGICGAVEKTWRQRLAERSA